MEFVTAKDLDYQAYLEETRLKNYSLREKKAPLLIDDFGKYCEKAIKLLVSSSKKTILKYKVQTKSGVLVYKFKEFDFHLPDKKTVGEVRLSFNRVKSRQRVNHQRNSIGAKIDDIGYAFQAIIVEVNDTKDAANGLIIDESPLVYLNAYALFQFCLDQKIIKDADFFDRMITQDKIVKATEEARIYRIDDNVPTLGALFDFQMF